MAKVIITGLKRGVDGAILESAIKETFLQATDHLAWLKSGQTVLLKPALNSPDPYPATTHPVSVKVVSELIAEHGGKAIVGDQSGIGHVTHGPKGGRGSSRDCYYRSKMRDGVTASFIAFEEQGWEDGFQKFSNSDTKSWSNGFYISKLVDQVDHIINLPRLSTHALAGVSLGFKNMVGLLREDSRLEFHANGPFNSFIQGYAKELEIRVTDDGIRTFFEKMVEISSAVRPKLRATLFVGTKAQTSFGPDRTVATIGAAHVEEPETGLVIASADQTAAEAAALAFLTLLQQRLPMKDKIAQKLLETANGRIHRLGRYPVWGNPFIKHALDLGWGSREITFSPTSVPSELLDAIEAQL